VRLKIRVPQEKNSKKYGMDVPKKFSVREPPVFNTSLCRRNPGTIGQRRRSLMLPSSDLGNGSYSESTLRGPFHSQL
jgi:hypothetical protein